MEGGNLMLTRKQNLINGFTHISASVIVMILTIILVEYTEFGVISESNIFWILLVCISGFIGLGLHLLNKMMIESQFEKEVHQ